MIQAPGTPVQYEPEPSTDVVFSVSGGSWPGGLLVTLLAIVALIWLYRRMRSHRDSAPPPPQ